ncbi:MAG: hypothetical protein J6Y56_03865 [Fibrobacterales bacterium]|nr:hypothetical protein [Fibrobacterales bacterium]
MKMLSLLAFSLALLASAAFGDSNGWKCTLSWLDAPTGSPTREDVLACGCSNGDVAIGVNPQSGKIGCVNHVGMSFNKKLMVKSDATEIRYRVVREETSSSLISRGFSFLLKADGSLDDLSDFDPAHPETRNTAYDMVLGSLSTTERVIPVPASWRGKEIILSYEWPDSIRSDIGVFAHAQSLKFYTGSRCRNVLWGGLDWGGYLNPDDPRQVMHDAPLTLYRDGMFRFKYQASFVPHYSTSVEEVLVGLEDWVDGSYIDAFGFVFTQGVALADVPSGEKCVGSGDPCLWYRDVNPADGVIGCALPAGYLPNRRLVVPTDSSITELVFHLDGTGSSAGGEYWILAEPNGDLTQTIASSELEQRPLNASNPNGNIRLFRKFARPQTVTVPIRDSWRGKELIVVYDMLRAGVSLNSDLMRYATGDRTRNTLFKGMDITGILNPSNWTSIWTDYPITRVSGGISRFVYSTNASGTDIVLGADSVSMRLEDWVDGDYDDGGVLTISGAHGTAACGDAPTWSAEVGYQGQDADYDGRPDGPQVVYEGNRYELRAWWSQGEIPASHPGTWAFVGRCDGSLPVSSSSATSSSSSDSISTSSSSADSSSVSFSSAVSSSISSSSALSSASEEYLVKPISLYEERSVGTENCIGLPEWTNAVDYQGTDSNYDGQVDGPKLTVPDGADGRRIVVPKNWWTPQGTPLTREYWTIGELCFDGNGKQHGERDGRKDESFGEEWFWLSSSLASSSSGGSSSSAAWAVEVRELDSNQEDAVSRPEVELTSRGAECSDRPVKLVYYVDAGDGGCTAAFGGETGIDVDEVSPGRLALAWQCAPGGECVKSFRLERACSGGVWDTAFFAGVAVFCDDETVYGDPPDWGPLAAIPDTADRVWRHSRSPVPEQNTNLISKTEYPRGNLIVNGTFEQGLNGWTASENVSLSRATAGEPVYDGRYAAKLAPGDTISSEIGDEYPAARNLREVGGVLRLRARALDNSATLLLAELSSGLAKTAALDAHWKNVELPLAPSAMGAVSEEVGPTVSLSALSGRILVDAVTLVPGNLPPMETKSYVHANSGQMVLQRQAVDARGHSVVSEVDVDELGRANSEWLPYPLQRDTTMGGIGAWIGELRHLGRVEGTRAAPAEIGGERLPNLHYDGSSPARPTGGGYARAETFRYADPLAEVSETTVPGALYNPANEGAKRAKTHKAAVSSANIAAFGSDPASPANASSPKFAYLHSVDRDGRYAVNVADEWGSPLLSLAGCAANPSACAAATWSEYDRFGRASALRPPLACGTPGAGSDCIPETRFAYDKFGRQIRMEEADAGVTRFWHDRLDRVVFSQSAEQRARGVVACVVYDDFGDVSATGFAPADETVLASLDSLAAIRALPPGFRPTTLFWRDRIPSRDELRAANISIDVYPYESAEEAAFVASHAQFGRGKLVASVSLGDPSADSALGRSSQTAVASVYDKFGREVRRYVTLGALTDSHRRTLRSDFEYDRAGRVRRRELRDAESGAVYAFYLYEYDSFGRVFAVLEPSETGGENRRIALWRYLPDGKIAEVEQLDVKMENNWTLRGAMAGTETRNGEDSVLFRQVLSYDSCPSGKAGCMPQYEGNIAVNSLFQGMEDSIPDVAHDYAYNYDMLNRLTASSDTVPVHGSTFSYDLRGRITGQSSGGNAPISYAYRSKSDQLDHLSAPLVFADDAENVRNLTANASLGHDSSGALVRDASRGATYSYDESGRLIAVTRMTPEGLAKTRYVYGADGTRLAKLTIAPTFPAVYTVGIHSADDDFATLDDACAALRTVEDSLPSEDITLLHIGETGPPVIHPVGNCLISRTATEKKIHSAALQQDADYRTRKFEIASITHYHPEVEIRESPDETTIILEHPEGLGRTVGKRGDEQRPEAREIYIRDHLGNVRMTIADSLGELSLMQSTDYTPFGRRIDVYSKDVETTPQFTSKEMDAETGLYHFGARQYDPELGLWAQVDPGRQFASPYAYAGNGVNPIVTKDDDGGKLRFADDASESFKYEFALAVFYANAGGVSGVLARLEARPETITIRSVKGLEETSFHGSDPEHMTIIWDAHGALKVSNEMVQSPTSGLLHEAYHVERCIDDFAGCAQRLDTKDDEYDNLEDKAIISGPETWFTQKLGEPSRLDHKGGYKWVEHADMR